MRYQLETVPGVAEVASIGGFVKQYQVQLDPNKLLAYGIPLSTVIDRVRASTNEVGGRVLEMNGARYMVRGLGYLTSLKDLEEVPVNAKNGTPVLLRDLGTVTFGPDIREGVAEWQGEGEAVGGIVVMRTGENALNVINGVKAKVAEIASTLPPGVEIHAGYDRSGLISESIKTLQRDLLLECVIVSFVTISFLFHFRSALIPILTLPVAAACGVHPDVLPARHQQHHVAGRICARDWRAGRCCHRDGRERLSASVGNARCLITEKQRRRILIDAAKQVGPALFFSLLIIVVSFLPVFLLEAQEGRMFRPLAWTKTLAVGFSSLLAITLVPVLMVYFIRGKLRPESQNPFSRITQAIYLPILRFALRYRWLTIAVNLIFLVVTIPLHCGLAASSCRRCLKARRSTCRRRCRESASRKRRSCSRNRTGLSAAFPKWTASSARSAAPTAPPTTRRSICTTPPSC